MDPFERFTQRAKRVLVLAQEEAERSQHSYIGTEHILLGLLLETDGVGAKVLSNLGVEINKVRATIEAVLGRNERIVIQQIIPTSRVKKVIEIAFEEARRLGNSYLGTEHLLLGLLIEGEGIAAHVLEDLGVSLEDATNQIQTLLPEEVLEKSETAHPSPTPVLDDCGRDLSELAVQDRLGRVVGCEREINRAIEVLTKASRNNVLLVGDPALRRSAVVEGIVNGIFLGNVPETLRRRRLVTLETDQLLTNARSRGQFSQRLIRILKEVIDELRSNQESVVLVLELGPMLRKGASEGTTEIFETIVPALARGQFQWIGLCSSEDYERLLNQNSELELQAESIRLQPPSLAETVDTLRRLKSQYEKHHRVVITDEAIAAAAELSNCSSETAAGLMDEASARVRTILSATPTGLRNMQKEIRKVQIMKEECIANQDYETAAAHREKEKELKDRYVREEMEWRDNLYATVPEVTRKDVASLTEIKGEAASEGVASD